MNNARLETLKIPARSPVPVHEGRALRIIDNLSAYFTRRSVVPIALGLILIIGIGDFETGVESSWERALDIAVRIRDGRWDPRMKQLETQWRGAATPSRAQSADAAVKLPASAMATKYPRVRRFIGHPAKAVHPSQHDMAARANGIGPPAGRFLDCSPPTPTTP